MYIVCYLNLWLYSIAADDEISTGLCMECNLRIIEHHIRAAPYLQCDSHTLVD